MSESPPSPIKYFQAWRGINHAMLTPPPPPPPTPDKVLRTPLPRESRSNDFDEQNKNKYWMFEFTTTTNLYGCKIFNNLAMFIPWTFIEASTDDIDNPE